MISNFIRVMVTMNEPDICQSKDGGEGLFERLLQTQIPKYDYRSWLILLNTQNYVPKFPMRVTTEQDHWVILDAERTYNGRDYLFVL